MKHDVVRLVIILSADLTLINAFIHWSNILYDQAPLVHSLVVVDVNASIRGECVQTYC